MQIGTVRDQAIRANDPDLTQLSPHYGMRSYRRHASAEPLSDNRDMYKSALLVSRIQRKVYGIANLRMQI
jgi:hypothetical protein